MVLPVMLQSSRNVGVYPPKPLRTGSELLPGTGMVMVMGLWNFLLRGSRVTMGLKVALFPKIFLTTLTLTGWACRRKESTAILGVATKDLIAAVWVITMRGVSAEIPQYWGINVPRSFIDHGYHTFLINLWGLRWKNCVCTRVVLECELPVIGST